MHGLPKSDLVLQHFWIVEKFQARYYNYAPPGADLKAAGALGLVEAAARFQPRRGLRFSTYAWSWVKGAVLAELRRCHVVPVAEWTARKDKRQGKPPRVVVVFGTPDESWTSHDAGDDPEQEEAADRAMRIRGLRAAAARLDEPHRFVVERTLAGRTPEQIGHHLGLGDERVRQLLREAQTLLAEDMCDEMCEDAPCLSTPTSSPPPSGR